MIGRINLPAYHLVLFWDPFFCLGLGCGVVQGAQLLMAPVLLQCSCPHAV